MPPHFNVALSGRWDEQASLTRSGMARATPFQQERWLTVWYRTLGSQESVKPLVVTVTRARDGELAAVLPMVVRVDGARRVAEFADLDITDYNSPLLGPAAPGSRDAAKSMFAAICNAIRAEADILHLTKMPVYCGDLANPLSLLAGWRPSTLSGSILRIAGDWQQYHRGLEKRFRKELERSLRVFLRDGQDARFVAATTVGDALRVLSAIEVQQRARIAGLGLPYLLDQPRYQQFYEHLVSEGVENGYVVVTALMNGASDVVAALLGICDGRSYAMIRLSHAGQAWAHCSPGRLVIERTMHHLHGLGITEFDFTIGDYKYKQGFQIARVPLGEMVVPLTWPGRQIVWRQSAAEQFKNCFRPAWRFLGRWRR